MNADRTSEQDPLTREILGAAFEVSNTLGHGFLEVVYQRALCHELSLRGLTTKREMPFKISYKGVEMGTYVADVLVEDAVIVELKAVEAISGAHVGQCLNYLRASGLKTAMVLNFGRPKLEYKRITL